MKISLDEEYHLYRDEDTGRIIPDSTTGLLKKLGFIQPVYGYNEYSRNRGTLAHRVAKLHLDGDLDEDSVDPVLVPYYHAVLSFLADTGFVVTRSEFVLYCKEWDFASTVDFEGYFPAYPSVLYLGDWKTGKMMDWVRWQLALEKIAAGEYRRGIGVELRKNGTYKSRTYGDLTDEVKMRRRLKQYKEELCQQKQPQL